MACKLRTDLTLTFSGEEVTFPGLTVEYTHRAATRDWFDGPLAGPGEPEHVEIGLVYVEKGGARNPLPEWMIEAMTESLERACLEDWRGRENYARESAAELRRAMTFSRRPQAAE